ncbi:MAG: thioredoxin [Nitrososphaerota archaeon]|nr:thioredoxin [Nitrososphaerota archaeon]
MQRPIILTDANFAQEIAKNTLMVVDFWAPWCGPCRMVGPIIEELARDHSGRVVFGKLNVDENPVTASSFQVQSIPTILIFYQGQAVDGVLGAVPKSLLESKIRPYLSGTRSANPYH